jgi:Ran GTPase-activating protein (RanGAP) involved in mRNA processing and transport
MAACLRLLVLYFDWAATAIPPTPAVRTVAPDPFVVEEDGLVVSVVYDVKPPHPVDAIRDVAIRYPNVRELSLQGFLFHDASGFEDLEKLSGLKMLDLQDNRITDITLRHLGRLVQLRSLNLGGTGISDDGLQNLVGMTGLEVLDVHNTAIGDTGVRTIVQLASLRSLAMSRTRVTDEGLAAFAALPHLRHLDLAATGVSDTGIASLCAGNQLESLSLSYTKVTDGVLPALTGMESLRELEIVNTGMTREGIETLRKRRPEMQLWTIPPHMRALE